MLRQPLDRARIGALVLNFPGHWLDFSGPANITHVIGRPRLDRASGIDLTTWILNWCCRASGYHPAREERRR